jgi:hypothetical protein
MTRAQRVRLIIIATALALLGGVTAVAVRRGVIGGQGAAQATYYCPMHPTYTAARPGQCPICHMDLVKLEDTGAAAPASAPAGGAAAPLASSGHGHASSPQFESICYLHNCAKLHGNKPCPMTVLAKPGEQVTCPICGTHIAEASTAAAPADRTILYWTDPMIPGFKSDTPGTSPMGMELVPVYAEAGTPAGGALVTQAAPDGYAPVLLTPEKQQVIGVATAPVERRSLAKSIRAAGIVAHDPELYQAQQEFLQAQGAYERARQGQIPEITDQARRLAESSRFRLRHLGLSEEMIEEIASKPEPDHRLLVGGTTGEYWVYASIYEYELPHVHAGQAVAVEVTAFPGTTLPGTVRALDRLLDPATRTVRARIMVQDPQGLLKPSMYVNVIIESPVGEALAVPASAVFSTGTRNLVFVAKGQGLFEPREVTLGAKAGNWHEVRAGLQQGEWVVISGNFLIDSESRLKAAIQGAAGSQHQHGQ